MNGIFSENKYLNTLIIVLLFLVGINFFHYGQLFLPIICLLLFIDNKMQFKVVNPRMFIILCLFAISFYAFSYEMGFYSVMAFTFPMAYYIGSNIRKCSSENIKKIILLFAFAMASHIFLNIIYELCTRSITRILTSSSHYDIWLQDKIVSTAIAINLVYLISSFYYLIYFEKNKIVKYLAILLYCIDLLFCIIIGRRTTLLLSILCIVFSFVYHGYITNELKKYLKKGLKLFLIVCVILGLLIGLFYIFDIDNMFINSYVLNKIRYGLFDHARIKIFIETIKLMPYHLWGKQEISSIVGFQPHELWLDIYDYAGIISYLIFHCYTFMYLLNIIKTHKSNIDNKHKTLFMTLFFAIFIQSFLEPLMTGDSIFLIISIIVGASIERLNYEQQNS